MYIHNNVVCLYNTITSVSMGDLHTVYDDSAHFDELIHAYSEIESREMQGHNEVQGISPSILEFINEKYGSFANFKLHEIKTTSTVNGFTRIAKLRQALAALDRSGWDRSYHQRIFHVFILTLFYVDYDLLEYT